MKRLRDAGLRIELRILREGEGWALEGLKSGGRRG